MLRVMHMVDRNTPDLAHADVLEALVVTGLRASTGLPLRVELASCADIQQHVDRDLPTMFPAATQSTWLRIWKNAPCLVASRHQSRMARFDEAASISRDAGWPVAVRRSGGTAVVHRPGVLNISLIQTDPILGKSIGLRDGFCALIDVLSKGLAQMGIQAAYGPVAAAHCDGDYNLCWQGRKLAGTAGFVTRVNGASVRVFHAALALSGAVADDLIAIERFETALGQAPAYDPAAHVTIADILKSPRHVKAHADNNPIASRMGKLGERR